MPLQRRGCGAKRKDRFREESRCALCIGRGWTAFLRVTDERAAGRRGDGAVEARRRALSAARLIIAWKRWSGLARF